MRGVAVFAVAACGRYGAVCRAVWPVAGTAPAAAVTFAGARVVPAGPVGFAARKHWLAARVAIAAPPARSSASAENAWAGKFEGIAPIFKKADFDTEPEGILPVLAAPLRVGDRKEVYGWAR